MLEAGCKATNVNSTTDMLYNKWDNGNTVKPHKNQIQQQVTYHACVAFYDICTVIIRVFIGGATNFSGFYQTAFK